MNLRRISKSSFVLRISSGYDAKGRQKQTNFTIRTDPTRTENAQRMEAEKKAAKIIADFERRLITDAKKITLRALASEYMSDYVRRKGLAQSTQRQYRDLLEGRILPALGKKTVQEITPRDLSAFYRALEEAPALSTRSRTGKLSGTVRLKYHTMLHALFAFAVRQGYISVNPADAVEPPRKDTGETKVLEMSSVYKLEDVLDALPDTQWRLYFFLALYTGMRPGELIALNWSDIEPDFSALWVNAGSFHVSGKGTIRTDRPKTEKSRRKIALSEKCRKLLQQHRREQAEYRFQFGSEWSEPDAVFSTDYGKRFCISTPTHKWKKLREKYDLPDVPLYSLRHTNATAAIHAGVPLPDISRHLGHSRQSTTTDIYSHAFADASRRTVDAIETAFSRKNAE